MRRLSKRRQAQNVSHLAQEISTNTDKQQNLGLHCRGFRGRGYSTYESKSPNVFDAEAVRLASVAHRTRRPSCDGDQVRSQEMDVPRRNASHDDASDGFTS